MLDVSRRGLLGVFAAGATAAIVRAPGLLVPIKPALVARPEPGPSAMVGIAVAQRRMCQMGIVPYEISLSPAAVSKIAEEMRRYTALTVSDFEARTIMGMRIHVNPFLKPDEAYLLTSWKTDILGATHASRHEMQVRL